MADGKETAVKTKSFISKKNAQNRPEPIQWDRGLGVSAFLRREVMTVMDMKIGFAEKIGGTIFVVSAMPAESAKHTQEEIVKALIAKEAMALREADIA